MVRILRFKKIGWTSLCRCSRGTAAVEFALIGLILILITVGMIEFGRAFWAYNTLQFVAEETARYAMVNQAADDTELTSYAQTKLIGTNAEDVVFTFTREILNDTDFITIGVSESVDLMTTLIPIGPISLTASTRVPLLE